MSSSQDAAKHMQAIREWVRQENTPGLTRHSSTELLLLTDSRLREHIAHLRFRQAVREQPFTSQTPVLGQFIVWFRSAWNWMSTKWYVLQIVQQQNEFNVQVVDAWTDLLQYLNHVVFFVRNVHLKLQHVEDRLHELETMRSVRAEGPFASPQPCLDLADITEIVQMMEPAFREHFKAGPVVALSCGRGEYLPILAEQGLEIYGLEADPALTRPHAENKVTVLQTADTAHLVSLSDETLGGVLAIWPGHVSTQEAVRLLSQCQRTLRPGAWAIWIWPWAAASDETNAQMSREIALGLGFQHVRLDARQQAELAFQTLLLQK